MRLVTYSAGTDGSPRAGVRVGHRVLDIEAASRVNGEPLPTSLKALLAAGRGALARVQALAKAAATDARPFTQNLYEEKAIRFLPPVEDAERFLRAGVPPAPGEAAALPEGLSLDASRLAGHNAQVALPRGAAGLACAPEMVFVIGRQAKDVDADDAADYVAGVTLLAAFCASGAKNGGKKPPASAGDLGSLGPDIVTLDEIADLRDLWMTCAVNGEERLRANTRDQAWTMPDVLAHFTKAATLEPGDMISIGAPGGCLAEQGGVVLAPGDVLEFAIEGVAALRATIAPAGA